MDHVGTTARVESAKLVKKRLTDLDATLPMFLSGDFNVDQFSPSYAEIIKGDLLCDSHDRAGMVYEVTGTYNGYSTDNYTPPNHNEKVHPYYDCCNRVRRFGDA